MRRGNNATTMSMIKEEMKMKKAAATTKKATATAANTNKEENAMKKVTAATMKKANTNTNKEETTMKKATETNALTINGVTITLSPEQSAAIAAMLMGGTTTASAPAPEAKKRGRKAKEVKAEPKEQAESVKKAAAEPFTDFKVLLAENRFSFAKADGTFLYQKAPRQALNNRLKAVCEGKGLSVKYNKEVWAWEVLNPRTGKVPGKTVLAVMVLAGLLLGLGKSVGAELRLRPVPIAAAAAGALLGVLCSRRRRF